MLGVPPPGTESAQPEPDSVRFGAGGCSRGPQEKTAAGEVPRDLREGARGEWSAPLWVWARGRTHATRKGDGEEFGRSFAGAASAKLRRR